MKLIKDNPITVFNKIHNIVPEKLELYYDFLLSLTTLINKTHPGDDALNTEIDIKNHFTWCFNTIIKNFEKEHIYFKNNGDYFDYIWSFYYVSYYTDIDKDEGYIKIKEYFKSLFNIAAKSYKNDADLLILIYNLFEKGIKEKTVTT